MSDEEQFINENKVDLVGLVRYKNLKAKNPDAFEKIRAGESTVFSEYMKIVNAAKEEERKMKKVCCDCKHFRMFKPKPEYCTVKKESVDPLMENCKDYVLRKNFQPVDASEVFALTRNIRRE